VRNFQKKELKNKKIGRLGMGGRKADAGARAAQRGSRVIRLVGDAAVPHSSHRGMPLLAPAAPSGCV